MRPNPPEEAFGKDETKAWCEGKPGDPIGEWLEVEIEDDYTIGAVDVTGGWAYNSPIAAAIRGDGDMWRLSHVATKIRVKWDTGEKAVTFSRARDRAVVKVVPIEAKTKTIRFTIERISRGDGGNNVCLDGLKIYGRQSQ